MDICMWNDRTDSNPDANQYYGMTSAIHMGVICSMSTKLPINLTLSTFFAGRTVFEWTDNCLMLWFGFHFYMLVSSTGYTNVNGVTIPTENGLLTSLQIFNLEHNDIIGTIPTELGQLTNLLNLNFGRNMLTGSIPVEIGRLSNLEYLSLRQNAQLVGSLPSSMTQLTLLQETLLDGTSVTLGIHQMCRADGSMVVYTDCDAKNIGGNYSTIVVDCECCRCCNDIDNNGTGCSV